VLGHGDPCLANFLCDVDQVRLVDFGDSGPSDRAFELAILTEHTPRPVPATRPAPWNGKLTACSNSSVERRR
jgi:Ser/Thr protein kinase RdoA (MazF antagonist)